MENTSLFLAKFWGWFLIVIFLILSFNPKRISQIMNDLNDQKFVILISLNTIVIGILNILFHNVWENDFRIIITLIGWATFFLGLALFILPKYMVIWLGYINIKFVQIIYIFLFLIGMFLLNRGYGFFIFN